MQLVESMWVENPEGRPTFQQVLKELNSLSPQRGDLMDNLIQMVRWGWERKPGQVAHGQRSTIRLPKVPSLNPASSLTNLCKILLHACCSVTVRFQNKKREKLLEPGIDRKKKSSLIPTLKSKTLLTSSSHKQCTAVPESWFDNTEARRQIATIIQVKRCLVGCAPPYMSGKFVTNSNFGYNHTRGANKLHLKRPNMNFYKHSFEFKGAVLYNFLPEPIRTVPTERSLCSALLSISDTFDQWPIS